MKILLFDKRNPIYVYAFLLAIVPGPALGLTLEDALMQSLKTSNEIASSREGWLAARESIFASGSTKETSFKYSGSASLSETDSGSGYKSSDSYSNKITMSKNLYDGGQSKENRLKAEISLQRTTAQYKGTEQGVILETVQSFLGLIKSRQEYELQTKNLDRLKQHVTAAEVRVSQGTDTLTSLAEAKARFARARADTALAKAQLESSDDSFVKITGVSSATEIKFPELLNVKQMLPETIGLAEELALKNNPSVLTAMAAEKAASQDLVITKTKQNSTVAFSLSATDGKSSDSLAASLTLSAPLYATNSTTSNARKIVALHSKSMIDLREALSAARLKARAAFRDWDAVKITLNAVEAEVEASWLVQKGVSNEVKYGLKTTLDMLDAEKSFSEAELRLVKAKHDEILAEFELISAVGNLTLENLGLGNPLIPLDEIPRPENPL